MKPSRVVAIVGCVVLICVLLICGLMYTTDQNEADDILSRYNRNTQHFDRISVVTVIEEIRRDEGTPGVPTTYIDPGEVTSWLDACVKAHHMMYHAGMMYSTTASGSINGMIVKADCSGYIGAAMYLYGLQSDMSAPTAVSLKNNTNLEYLGAIPLDQMQPGDILVYPRHIEVLAKKDPGQGYAIGVYNWGSSSTAEGLYANDPSGHDANGCTQSILVGSNTYKSNQAPDVYRIKADANTVPQTPPITNPITPPNPNPPGVPQPGPIIQPPMPSGAKALTLPLIIEQNNYGSTMLGTSSISVASAGCFACSLQMAANFLVSPGAAWDDATIKSNFGIDYFSDSGGMTNRSSYIGELTNDRYTITGDVDFSDATQITNAIDNGIPVIMHFDGFVNNYYTQDDGEGQHFVLIYGYDSDNIYIVDPAKQRLKEMPIAVAIQENNVKLGIISKR